MKTLYLLRHAHAKEAAPAGMNDHERVLSAQGVREAEELAAHMRTHGIHPDLVLSSSSARTSQTANILFGPERGVKVETCFDRALYLASASRLLETVRAVDEDVRRLMIVAHNPGLGELVYELSAHALVDFPTAALAVFSVNVGNWRDFFTDDARLESLFMPSLQ